MSFKDIIATDLSDVFFDETEFADLMCVDGREITCHFQGDSAKGDAIAGLQGVVYKKIAKVFVRAEEYGSKPKANKTICIGASTYRIVDVAAECGIYILDVETVRS